MAKRKIGTVADFPSGRATLVEVEGIPISVFKIEGEFYAIHDRCPHKDLPLHRIGDEASVPSAASVDKGEPHTLGSIDEAELVVQCPWHSLDWELETGRNPLTNRSISTFDVEAEGDEVYLEI